MADISQLPEAIIARIVPLVYDDTMTQIELVGAIAAKCNELIELYNAADAKYTNFNAWVDAHLNEFVSDEITAKISDGTFAGLINGPLFDTFKAEINATVTAASAANATAIADANAANAAAITTANNTNAALVADAIADNQTAIDLAATANATLIADSNAANNTLVQSALDELTAGIAANQTAIDNAVAGLPVFIGIGRVIQAVDEADFAAKAGAAQPGDLWVRPNIDAVAPIISGTLVAIADQDSVTLSGAVASDMGGILKWQYRLNGGAWVDVISVATVMPATTIEGLNAGTTYVIDVRVIDNSGNASSALTLGVTPSIVTTADTGAGMGIGYSSHPTLARSSAGVLYSLNHKTSTNAQPFVASTADLATWSAAANIVNDTGFVNATGMIAVDSAGVPHVLFYGKWAGSSTYFGIRHAYKNGGTWTVENIAVPSTVDLAVPCFAIDSTDNLHVVYRSLNTVWKYIKGTKNGATWTWGAVEDIATTTSTGRYGFALDDLGVPYLAYVDSAAMEVRLRHRRSGAWSVATTVAGGVPNAALSCSILVLGSGNTARVIVAYTNDADAFVKMSEDGGTTFGAAAVMSGAETLVNNCSLAMSGDTTAFVSWDGVVGSFREVFVRPFNIDTLTAGATINVTSGSTVDQSNGSLLQDSNLLTGFVIAWTSANTPPARKVKASTDVSWQ